jgi:hypothetical protein
MVDELDFFIFRKLCDNWSNFEVLQVQDGFDER